MTGAADLAWALGLRRSGRLWCGACPSCGYPGTFTVRDGDRRVLFRCHAGCGQADVLDALRARDLCHAEPAVDPHAPRAVTPSSRRSAAARALWRQTAPAAGTPAESYLRTRGIGLPSWAACSAGGLEALLLPPLPLAAEVVLAADHDPPGLAAADRAARRWTLEGRRVRIAVPAVPGTDWNDVLRATVHA